MRVDPGLGGHREGNLPNSPGRENLRVRGPARGVREAVPLRLAHVAP